MVMFTRITLAALLFVSVTLSGCLDNQEAAEPEGPAAPEVTMNDLIAANNRIVRDAVEAYALENNGVYPVASDRRNLVDKRLKDYLPNAQYLVNPSTGLPSEPSIGAHPHEPGGTGCVALVNSEGVSNGYEINGLDENYDFIATIRREPVD